MPHKPRRVPRHPKVPRPPIRAAGVASVSRAAAGIRWTWLLLPVLLLVVAIAYQPAWRGGLLWDDDAHLTRPALRSSAGLWRIWTDIGATQQYYPLLHSAFWIQHRLWGDEVLGYHLVSIALHAISAWLVALILIRWTVPGALLSAFVFALHPVHVESVAWISELKNTLSGVLCLASALAYLRFDESRRTRDYTLALVSFVLGLLTKTVIATLPAVLLVIFWWRRGRVSVARDVRPLAPFAMLGLAGGLVTVWVERTVIGASGAGFDLTTVDRVLVAGRAVWFYLGTLAWPLNLTFIYPRWDVTAATWWQVLYPVASFGVAAALWGLRHRSRAPAAAFAMFVVTLSPALGFVNVYPFRYAFVADHFQYLASIPVIALAASAIILAARRWTRSRAFVAAVTVIFVIAPLGVLTWSQSRDYASAERLYRATIARSPTSWMAHNNLALILLADGRVDEAREHLKEALRLGPDIAEHHLNMGRLLLADGEPAQALGYLQAAVRLEPRLVSAQNNFGVALMRLGRANEAVTSLMEAVRLQPDHADAHANLAEALHRSGRDDDAARHIRAALALNPGLAPAHRTAGLIALARQAPGEARSHLERATELDPTDVDAALSLAVSFQQLNLPDEAVALLTRAVQVKPSHAPAHYLLGVTLFRLGRTDEAVERFTEAIRLDARLPDVRNDLGAALLTLGRIDEAIRRLREAIQLDPEDPGAQYNLAHALHATGRVGEAVGHYREAVRLTPADAVVRNDYGVALLTLGRRAEAVEQFTEALRLQPDLEAAKASLARIR